jgi:predicted RNA-binding Zn-ribbon protein involved in translation (DUF1610 family)
MASRKKSKTGAKKKPMNIVGYVKTAKECPRCGSKLSIAVTMAQIYFCTNCGYMGPIALNPEPKNRSTRKPR